VVRITAPRELPLLTDELPTRADLLTACRIASRTFV
jgi:hypothetical protein